MTIRVSSACDFYDAMKARQIDVAVSDRQQYAQAHGAMNQERVLEHGLRNIIASGSIAWRRYLELYILLFAYRCRVAMASSSYSICLEPGVRCQQSIGEEMAPRGTSRETQE